MAGQGTMSVTVRMFSRDSRIFLYFAIRLENEIPVTRAVKKLVELPLFNEQYVFVEKSIPGLTRPFATWVRREWVCVVADPAGRI